MRLRLLLLALLLSAPLTAPLVAEGPSAVVIRVRGDLDAAQVSRVQAELDSASARGFDLVLIDFALDSAPGDSALALIPVVKSLSGAADVVGLASGKVPGAALPVLLSCRNVYMAPDATLGPISSDTAVLDALTAIFEERKIPHAAYRPLLWPTYGTIDADAASDSGMARLAARGRVSVLEVYEVQTDSVDERGTEATSDSSQGRRRTVQGKFSRAAVIPIDIPIDDTLSASIRRRVKEARADGAELIVFEMDSPGGLVSSSMEIGDYIFDLDLPTVMLVLKGAYSGAALISLGGDEIILGIGGIIGDCQPIAVGPGGYEVLGEKVQSPLRAIFRKYAERNGYPIALAEGMVTQEMEVFRVTFADDTVFYLQEDEIEAAEEIHGTGSRDRVLKKDELLTLHAKEAYEYGFCGPLVKTRAEALARFGLTVEDAPVLEETWAETTSRFLLAIKGLLFFIGIVALYMELKAPGFGVPGTIALIAFAMFFSASIVAGIASELEVILFVLGVLCIALELLVIPGFGVPGIAGIGLVLISLYMASIKYGLPSPGRPWEFSGFASWSLELGGAVVFSLIAMYLIARVLPGTPLGRRLILAPAGAPGSQGLTGSGSTRIAEAAGLVGMVGRALTDLRPAGRIDIGEEPHDAVTEGDFIEAGSQVAVLEVKGNRIVVKKVR